MSIHLHCLPQAHITAAAPAAVILVKFVAYRLSQQGKWKTAEAAVPGASLWPGLSLVASKLTILW